MGNKHVPEAVSREGPASERASGTVLMLGSALMMLIRSGSLLLLLQTTAAASRAATAADLVALAAADTVRELRTGDPCAVAGEVAGRNGAVLAGCTVDPGGRSVQVATEVPVPLLMRPAIGHARAGSP